MSCSTSAGRSRSNCRPIPVPREIEGHFEFHAISYIYLQQNPGGEGRVLVGVGGSLICFTFYTRILMLSLYFYNAWSDFHPHTHTHTNKNSTFHAVDCPLWDSFVQSECTRKSGQYLSPVSTIECVCTALSPHPHTLWPLLSHSPFTQT